MSFPEPWPNYDQLFQGDYLLGYLDKVVRVNRPGKSSIAVNISDCKVRDERNNNKEGYPAELTWWANTALHQKWASELSAMRATRILYKGRNKGFHRFSIDQAVDYNSEACGKVILWRAVGIDPHISLKWKDSYQVSGVVEFLKPSAPKNAPDYVGIRVLTLDKELKRQSQPLLEVDFSLQGLQGFRRLLEVDKHITIVKNFQEKGEGRNPMTFRVAVEDGHVS